MNIQAALKETGKAKYEGVASHVSYVMKDENECLAWYDHEGVWCCRVFYEDAISDEWQPYHDKKEIRPEKAGELWKNKDGRQFYTHNNKPVCADRISITYSAGDRCELPIVTHNQCNWVRVYPPVEDDPRI